MTDRGRPFQRSPLTKGNGELMTHAVALPLSIQLIAVRASRRHTVQFVVGVPQTGENPNAQANQKCEKNKNCDLRTVTVVFRRRLFVSRHASNSCPRACASANDTNWLSTPILHAGNGQLQILRSMGVAETEDVILFQ